MSEHSNDNGHGASREAVRCPICGKARSADYRPFCSKRCADVDLGRWLKGDYAIPVGADDDEDGDAPDMSPGTVEQGGEDEWRG